MPVDFGIMGRLDPWTRRVYAGILLAFLSRDYARAAQVHREAGYIPADRDIPAFAQALRAIGEPIFGLGAANISMARLLGQLFVVTEQFGMETREELILLQKTMVMAEGVARSLDPDVNMWNAARPVVESWVRDNLGPKAMLRDLRDAALTLSRIGPLLPGLAEGVVMKASRRAPAEPKGGAGVWLFLGGGAVGALLAAIGARFF